MAKNTSFLHYILAYWINKNFLLGTSAALLYSNRPYVVRRERSVHEELQSNPCTEVEKFARDKVPNGYKGLNMCWHTAPRSLQTLVE